MGMALCSKNDSVKDGIVVFDFHRGPIQRINLTGNIAISVINLPTDRTKDFTLEVQMKNAGRYFISFPPECIMQDDRGMRAESWEQATDNGKKVPADGITVMRFIRNSMGLLCCRFVTPITEEVTA